ncbi:MAG: amidase family protein [Ilumatobacteraceae bacterium]
MVVDVGGLVELTAVEQRRLIATKQVSATELLDAHLARIAAVNPAVNAVISLDAEVGRARARAVDDAIAHGDDPGPLAGLVTAHKDLSDTADFPTTFGSPLFAGFRPAADSVLVARMKAAGAVAIGKTNTPELGAGSHTFNPVHGTTYNPWGLTRSAGGSSGGAAAALACRMVAIADGSDMGGSLRNPAAWGNVVGLRTTARIVPRVGPGNPWLPLTTEGPMGRTVDDVLLLLRVIGVPDPRDPLSRTVELPGELRPPDRPLRIAWSDDLGVPVELEQAEVLAGMRRTMDALGWDVVDAEPDLDLAGDCFRVLRAWSSANSPTAESDRLAEVKQTVRDEIADGRVLTAAQVAVAWEQLASLRRTAVEFFDRGFDVLACPVTQVAPFPTEWQYPTEVAGHAMADYIDWMASCWRITVTGCPALSLPAGFDRAGLPVGIQLVAPLGADVDLLRAAKALETATGHGAKRPPILPELS